MGVGLGGICPIMKYLRRQHAIIEEYVTGRLIYIICKGAEKMEGSNRFLINNTATYRRIGR